MPSRPALRQSVRSLRRCSWVFSRSAQRTVPKITTGHCFGHVHSLECNKAIQVKRFLKTAPNDGTELCLTDAAAVAYSPLK